MTATQQPVATPSAGTRLAGRSRPAPVQAVPLRHPGRWFAAIIVALFTTSLLLSIAQNPNLDWPTVGEYLFAPLTLSGLATTLYLTVAAMVIGLSGGIVVAVMRLSPNPVLRVVSGLFVWVFRGTPVLLQLIFWGFIGAFVPKLVIGIPFTSIEFWSVSTSDIIPATVAALLALGLNEMAYASEIVRAGIQSVDLGQTEAAHSLGMSPGKTLRRIVLPQAMRVIVPPMGNEVITMLKTTALVSVIAGHDLMSNLQAAYAQNYKIIPLLVVAAIWYLVLTSVLNVPQMWLERRYGRGVAGARVGAVGWLLRLRKKESQ
ncbi:polar amino acid transport system permease protein [Rhodoglobus vestalii]|uniref:Polar amino acid transport system permease protein n=1 Tax=Rhodoglobus vestalii TaxID=193384 RepID=A0A8H2K305_9MICO|nr:amino acid ABC transporter permease [Rhodoglobus vestalii]TQO18808.1 polar amino acid transport system permease protein [Rhodoglobus vestalii]